MQSAYTYDPTLKPQATSLAPLLRNFSPPDVSFRYHQSFASAPLSHAASLSKLSVLRSLAALGSGTPATQYRELLSLLIIPGVSFHFCPSPLDEPLPPPRPPPPQRILCPGAANSNSSPHRCTHGAFQDDLQEMSSCPPAAPAPCRLGAPLPAEGRRGSPLASDLARAARQPSFPPRWRELDVPGSQLSGLSEAPYGSNTRQPGPGAPLGCLT